jgi:hypothetical protein
MCLTGMISRRLAGPRLVAVSAVAAAALAGCAATPTPTTHAAQTTGPGVASTGASIGQSVLANPTCLMLRPSGHSTIADQEAADAAYARVDHLVRTLHLVGYAGGYVNLRARQAHIYWVGPVPQALRQLPKGHDGGTVIFHPASYALDQMKPASVRLVEARLRITDPSDYVISGAGPCLDGTGIRVEVADPAHGNTAPKTIPPTLVAKIKAMAGDMPVLVVGGYIGHAAT